MKFDIQYDESGKPSRVNIDEGFCQVSRPYNASEDGWMMDQLDYADFSMIEAGYQMRMLVDEVNSLRRRNFELEQQVKMWTKAAGFGGE